MGLFQYAYFPRLRFEHGKGINFSSVFYEENLQCLRCGDLSNGEVAHSVGSTANPFPLWFSNPSTPISILILSSLKAKPPLSMRSCSPNIVEVSLWFCIHTKSNTFWKRYWHGLGRIRRWCLREKILEIPREAKPCRSLGVFQIICMRCIWPHQVAHVLYNF